MMLSSAKIFTLLGYFHLSVCLPSESHPQQRGAFDLVKRTVTITANTVDTNAVDERLGVYMCEDINWEGHCQHFFVEDMACCKP
jgi:hypothetical protein